MIFTVCVNGYFLCDLTAPRWLRYSEWHGYDFLRVRTRNKTITGIATPAWDRIFLAQQLLTQKGYQQVMHVDGDSAVLAWETSLEAYFHNRTGPFAEAPGDTFMYLSQDRGRFGAYHPTKNDFARGIALSGTVSGPNNFAMFVMRNRPITLEMLQHLIRQSQRVGRAFQKWPAEQGVLNAWLGQNCSVNRRRAGAPDCVYAQAAYGSFQRFISVGNLPASKAHEFVNLTIPKLNSTLRLFRDEGVFMLHTPAMSMFTSFLMQTFINLDALFPIGTAASPS